MSITGRLAKGFLCVKSNHPSIPPFSYLFTQLSTFPYTCLFSHHPTIHPFISPVTRLSTCSSTQPVHPSIPLYPRSLQPPTHRNP